MLDKVAQQAVAMSAGITARSVVSRADLFKAARYFCGAAAALLLLFAVNFQQTKILFQRFWTPGADITMTQLIAKNGDMVVGKGDDVNLEFLAKGKVTPSANFDIRTANRKESVSVQKAATEAKYDYAVNSVGDSFEYRARAGDAVTAWHKVTVLDRPKISQVKMKIVPPAYTHLPTVEQAALPRQLRAVEGSRMEVSFKSDQPLKSMELKFTDGKSVPITESPDHTYHFSTTLTNTIAFQPVFTNQYKLDNLSKPTCQVIVYPDQPPTVNVITPSREITARPDDKVKVDFEARDDFGLSKAEMVVTVKNETNSTTTVIPIPLTKEETGAKKIRKQVDLDLAKFNLKQDQELSYVVRVTDTKENAALSTGDQQQQSGKQEASQKPEESKQANTNQKQNQKPNSNLTKSDKQPNAQKSDKQSNSNNSSSKQQQANNSKPSESQTGRRPETHRHDFSSVQAEGQGGFGPAARGQAAREQYAQARPGRGRTMQRLPADENCGGPVGPLVRGTGPRQVGNRHRPGFKIT